MLSGPSEEEAAQLHEMPIAQELVRQALELAGAHRATRVISVEVEIGALRLVAPEALRVMFGAASEGTPVEGTALSMTEVAPEAVCRSCGHRYEPEIGDFLCPRCGRADAEVVAGNDIVLKSVEMDVAGPARPAPPGPG